MAWSIDARIPIFFRNAAMDGLGAALLLEGELAAPDGAVVARFSPALPTHTPGCPCCAPRGDAARALGKLFLARARGETALFGSVVAVCTTAGRAEVMAALASDPLVSARFRLGE